MLTDKVPIDKITGLVVANAHNVTPASSEAFILRLFRHANHTGFIKAVTDNAHAFINGYNLVEKVWNEIL
jgi:DNA excision repair protein ERCC-4